MASVTGVSVPLNNFSAQCYPQQESERRVIQGEAVVGLAGYTLKRAEFFLHPKYSALLTGIQMIRAKEEGYLKGFSVFMGTLFVAASPAWGIVRVVGGGVPTLAGLAGTALVGTAYVIQELVLKIKSAVHQTPPEEIREHLTKLFVTRMHLILQKLDDQGRTFFKDNPDQLISIALISVTFLSRNVEGDQIRVGDELLGFNKIKKMDNERKQYFTEVCAIKNLIRDMHLGPDDEHAWQWLLTQTTKLTPEELETVALQVDDLEEGWTAVPKSEKLEVELMSRVICLSKKITEDPVFQRLWHQSLN